MKYFFVIIAAVSFAVLNAQEERGVTRAANKLLQQKNYPEAEATYKKALDINKKMPQAVYGLGNALYQQKRYDEAIKQYQQALPLLTDSIQKAYAMHNIGNAHLQQEKYNEAIAAYKNALKINPTDKDTKYNLAYANLKKKQQEQDKKNDKQNQQQNQQQQQSPQSKDGGKQGQNQPQQKQGGLSKEQTEKLLEALRNAEQKTMEKVNKKEAPASNSSKEKDW